MTIRDFLEVGKTYLFNYGELGFFVAVRVETLEDSNNDWVIGRLTCLEGTLEPIAEEEQRIFILNLRYIVSVYEHLT